MATPPRVPLSGPSRTGGKAYLGREEGAAPNGRLGGGPVGFLEEHHMFQVNATIINSIKACPFSSEIKL